MKQFHKKNDKRRDKLPNDKSPFIAAKDEVDSNPIEAGSQDSTFEPKTGQMNLEKVLENTWLMFCLFLFFFCLILPLFHFTSLEYHGRLSIIKSSRNMYNRASDWPCVLQTSRPLYYRTEQVTSIIFTVVVVCSEPILSVLFRPIKRRYLWN